MVYSLPSRVSPTLLPYCISLTTNIEYNSIRQDLLFFISHIFITQSNLVLHNTLQSLFLNQWNLLWIINMNIYDKYMLIWHMFLISVLKFPIWMYHMFLLISLNVLFFLVWKSCHCYVNTDCITNNHTFHTSLPELALMSLLMKEKPSFESK